MEDYKFVIKNKKFILFFILFNAVFLFSYIFAYSPYYTHPDLTEEIAKLFNSKNSNQDLKISQNEIQWMRQGAIDEDAPPRWINHFYDPIHKVGWLGKHFGTLSQAEGLYQGESMAPKPAIASIDWATNQKYQAAYGRQYGNQTWQKAIKLYIDGDKKSAFIAMGHILHLIEDASVPDHTRNDTHADLYGDPGSPYEKYSKEYTNFNKLNIAENLKSKELYNFSTIQDAFEYLANYSNSNFFSEDTISNKEFSLPNLEKFEEKIENIGDKKYLFLYDQQKKIYAALLKENDKYSTNNESFILPSYFNNLAPQAVMTGTSVLNLFFQEAEKYKNNPELLPEIIQDSNEAILSYFKKSPRLALVNANDFVDRTTIDTKIYLAALSSFFGNYANFLSAQLSGLIPSGAQTQGQTVGVQQISPAMEIPQSDTPATSPIAYEVPIMPTAQTANMQSDTPMAPAYQVAISLTEPPTATSTFSAITATITAPVFHGNGSVTGVSPDAVATLPPVEPPLTSSETSTTTDVAATSTDNTATSTEPVVVVTASPTPETVDGPPVVINEIAWMGTKAQANDEWIELYNKTNHDIDLFGWTLESRNKVFSVALSKAIPAHGYFLLERTASTTTDRAEDLIYKGALNDSGSEANIYLKNGTTTADYFDLGYWPFVNNKDTRHTLERVSPYATSTNSYNWKEYSEALTPPFAKDAGGGDIFGTPGRKNSVAGYYTPTGSITEDTVWRKAHSPYYVPPFIMSVADNVTLTIEPGVVVKFAKGALYGGGMDVRGMLRAEGTVVNPIVFTSFLDDTADGIDSNQDGSASVPASADWMNINFYGTSTPSVFSYVQVQYGGQGMNNSSSGWYPKYTGVFSVHGASPHITDSVFDKNHAISLYMENGAHPMLARNTIKNTIFASQASAWMSGFGVRIADASSTADIIGNIFENNNIGISSESATSTPLIVKDNVFTRNQKNGEFNGGNDFNVDNTNNQDSENKGGFYIRLVVRDGQVKILKADVMPYIVENGITVQEGGVLAIEPGAVLKSKDLNNSGSFAVPFIIKGVLHAQGTTDHPIVFTAFEDDSDGYDSNNSVTLPAAGAWENIQFLGATSSGSVLEYVAVRYGGLGRTACNSWCIEYKGAVRIQDASPTISHATFDQNLAIAVFIEGAAQPIIEYSDIRNTKEAIKTPSTTIGGIGMSIGAGLMPTLIDNTFTNNLEDVVYR